MSVWFYVQVCCLIGAAVTLALKVRVDMQMRGLDEKYEAEKLGRSVAFCPTCGYAYILRDGHADCAGLPEWERV